MFKGPQIYNKCFFINSPKQGSKKNFHTFFTHFLYNVWVHNKWNGSARHSWVLIGERRNLWIWNVRLKPTQSTKFTVSSTRSALKRDKCWKFGCNKSRGSESRDDKNAKALVKIKSFLSVVCESIRKRRRGQKEKKKHKKWEVKKALESLLKSCEKAKVIAPQSASEKKKRIKSVLMPAFWRPTNVGKRATKNCFYCSGAIRNDGYTLDYFYRSIYIW